MHYDHDPLVILGTTKDPNVAAWAMNELAKAGFTNVESIARDFGWETNKEN